MSLHVSTADLNRSFRRGFTLTFVADLLAKSLSAVTVVVLIRGLTVSAYAYTTLFLTLAQFAGAAAGGGVRTRYLREEAEIRSRGRNAERHDGQFLLALVKNTLFVAAFGLVALPLVASLGLGTKFGAGLSLVGYAVAFAVGYGTTELAIAHHQARRRFAVSGMLTMSRAAAMLVAATVISLSDANVQLLSVAFVAAMVLVGAGTAAPVAREALRGRIPRMRGLRFNAEENWLSLYYLAAAGFAYVDVLVASALLNKEQVATLGAALRYLAIVLAATPSLGAILRVRTAQRDMIDSHATQRAMLLGWMRAAAPLVALGGVMLATLAPWGIPILDGGRYPGSVRAFQILLAIAAAAYVAAPAASVLMAQRRYRALAVMFLAALAVNLAGDVLVARPLGVTGIAVVSATVYVCLDAALTVTALRYAAFADGAILPARRAPRAAGRRALRAAARPQVLQMSAVSLVALILAFLIATPVRGTHTRPLRFLAAPAASRADTAGRWYSPTSLWNTPIDAQPQLAPNNASLIAALTHTSGFGVSYDYTPAVWYAAPNTPKVPVRVDAPQCGARIVWVPIPKGAIPDPSPEGFMTIAQRGTNIEYDLYRAQSPNQAPKSSIYYATPCRTVDQWTAARVGITNWRTGNGELATGGRGSGTAEGAGTILPRDTQMPAGATWDHALAAAYANTCSPKVSWCPTVAPATQEDGTCTDRARCLPEGTRLQLDPAINCSTWPSLTYIWQRQACRTLQVYGMIIVNTNDAGPTIPDQWYGSLIGYRWPWMQSKALNLPRDLLSHFRVLAWQ